MGRMMTRIIVALDDLSVDDALLLAKKLSDEDVVFKVNDLLDDRGPEIIAALGEYGGVMADPKLHDIPNTVKNRIKKYIIHGPDFITVHASGGVPMMKAAVENRGDSGILAVTVLTSLNEDECKSIFGGSVKDKVLQHVRNAVLACAQGIVCSPKELEFLSETDEFKNLIKVTPGIRPRWSLTPNDDQSRVMTPYNAARKGADYIVIGRPIVQAKDPLEAVKKTKDEILSAFAE
jgi:orotidine-5'-phosphate decarboxylase